MSLTEWEKKGKLESSTERRQMRLFDIIQLFVILGTIAVFGYYYYLAGKIKGFLDAIRVFIEYSDDEPRKYDNK